MPSIEDEISNLASTSGVAMLARAMEWMRSHEKLCDEGRADIKRMVDLLHTRIASLRQDLSTGMASIRSDLRADRERELDELDKRREREVEDLDIKWADRCAALERAIEVSNTELKESTSGWRKLAWWAMTGVAGIMFAGNLFFIVTFVIPKLVTRPPL